MIWFFTRGSTQVDLEVRRAPESGAYALVVLYPDGTERVEEIRDPRRLIERTLEVQQRLIKDGWIPTGPAGPVPAAVPRSAPGLSVARPARPPWWLARVRVRELMSGVQRTIRRAAAVLGL